MERRDFLLGATAGAGALLGGVLPGLPGEGGGRPGGEGSRGKLGPIGIQLYTVREQLAKDPAGTLARLAEIGFREVEFAGFPANTARSLRAMLDSHRMTAPSGHVGYADTRTGWDIRLDEAEILGHRYLVIASVPAGERRTEDDWKRIAAQLNLAGEKSAARKIQLAYHNHEHEFGLMGGRPAYDLLLAETDRHLVQFEVDIYWMTRGGKDPVDYFARWPGRFPLLHVKDMTPPPTRTFADLGRGVIDFKRVFAHSRQAGVKHYFYEQDTTPGSPFDSARVGFAYLKSLRF